MKRVLLVINPSSGGEQAKEFEQLTVVKLESVFDEVIVLYTKRAGGTESSTRKAATEGYHSVFVTGGDRTINEGISGIAEQEHRPSFGFFPLGTVNDLARALRIPLEPKKAIDHFSTGSVKPLDIGEINDNYFINAVATGSILEVINGVNTEKKTKFGKLAYFMSETKRLASTQSYSSHVEVDGKREEIESSILLIRLINSVGGSEILLPSAKVDDNKFRLVYLKGPPLIDTPEALPNLLKGVDGSTKNLAYLTYERLVVSLTGERELATNVDGDEGGKLPVTIEVLPSHLQVYC